MTLGLPEINEFLAPFTLPFIFFPLYLYKKLSLKIQKKMFYRSHHFLKIKVYFFLLYFLKSIQKIDFSRKKDYYVDISFKEINIGDILLIRRKEVIPFDVLLLSTENDFCYLQTSLFNGKTQMVLKSPLKLTSGFC